jgi:hypothetical protein
VGTAAKKCVRRPRQVCLAGRAGTAVCTQREACAATYPRRGSGRGRGWRQRLGTRARALRPAVLRRYGGTATRGGALERGSPWRARRRASQHDWLQCSLVWPRFTPKTWTEVHRGVNSKVVDLTTLYNFYKGSIVFFSTDFAESACQLWMPPCLGEQEVLPVDQVFRPFPLKIWNAILHESCVHQQAGQLL